VHVDLRALWPSGVERALHAAASSLVFDAGQAARGGGGLRRAGHGDPERQPHSVSHAAHSHGIARDYQGCGDGTAGRSQFTVADAYLYVLTGWSGALGVGLKG
jgi:hypothetical protein